jgi:hypothetical protein
VNTGKWQESLIPIHTTLKTSMNEFLKELVIKAGAPEEVVNELWFSIFCQQFAHLIISEMENME